MIRITLAVMFVLELAAGEVALAADTIRPDEVAPGAAAVCLTDMGHGEIVRIPATVLGTVGPSAPEREIVLVRLDDERFADTGIIAGMSGSPVYVDGRLLGALAFGWSFSLAPIGGVTPFARMEEVGTAAPEARASAGRPSFADLLAARRDGTLGRMVVDWLTPPDGGALRSLPVAVSVGGWPGPGGEGWLADAWQRLGWVTTTGAGRAQGAAAAAPLRPGSMMAAVMVDGDAVVAAGGTVTEVRGDQVWAFGHPFLGAGAARLPLAEAQVVGILPSRSTSFKFFNVGDMVGTLRSDRLHGVWGRLGEQAPMVPVDVTVDAVHYSFRAFRNPVLLPLLTAYLTQSSLAARGRAVGDQTVVVRMTVGFDGQRDAVLEDDFAGTDAPAQAAAITAAVMAYLENSTFAAPEPSHVQIQLTTRERLEGDTLVQAMPERTTVAPGETVGVLVRLRPYRGRPVTRRVEIRVPPETPEGRLDLVVADGASWSAYDLQMRPLRPTSFADELRLFDRLLPADRLVLALERRLGGVALGGGTLSVPPSVLVQMRSALGPNVDTTSHAVVARVTEPLGAPMSGAQRIPLTVRRARGEN